jgi:CheY-like chemotaxis protein
MLISLRLRSYASDRCLLFSKTRTVLIIPDYELPFHLIPSRTYRYRILYVGNDLALQKYLQSELGDCQVVRCPDGSALTLIKHISYSLLLFDEELPDMMGKELAQSVRSLEHREQTPIIVCRKSECCASVARAIKRILTK